MASLTSRCVLGGMQRQRRQSAEHRSLWCKPLDPALKKAGVASGIEKWTGRWGFLFYVVVLSVELIDAAYSFREKVPIATNAIWWLSSR